jgi:2-aminobenzoylacetyl-CoA thioesterase
MLIKATGPIHTDLFLLTLGRSCHYMVCDEDRFHLFDPGLSIQIPFLLKRIEALGWDPSELEYILITHLHADRIGGIPRLKKMFPKLKVAGSPHMRNKLAIGDTLREIYDADIALGKQFDVAGDKTEMDFEEYQSLFNIDKVIVDADLIRFQSEIAIRVINYPGHTSESLAYFIQPYRYLVVDEGLGYHNGRKLAAPGGDVNLRQALDSIAKFNDLDIAGICFPSGGVMTGHLVRKHIQAIVQNTNDLFTESLKAYKDGVPEGDIETSIKDSFYTPEHPDPLLRHNMETSFRAVLRQIADARLAPEPSPSPEKTADTEPSATPAPAEATDLAEKAE